MCAHFTVISRLGVPAHHWHYVSACRSFERPVAAACAGLSTAKGVVSKSNRFVMPHPHADLMGLH